MRYLLVLLFLLVTLPVYSNYSELRDDSGNLLEVSRGDYLYREVRDANGDLLRTERMEGNFKTLRDSSGNKIGVKRYESR